jgi:hypothetical protein
MSKCCARAFAREQRNTPRVTRRYATLALVALGVSAGSTRADDGRMIDDDTFALKSHGPYLIDAGLLVGLPAALPSGITTGIGAGLMRECGCHFGYGVRASWSTETASSVAWTVTHWDTRLRAVGEVRYDAGRGRLALRLGAGTTIVHEHRERNQGMRAGLTGSALEDSATDALPAGEFEAVVGLRITGSWLALISGGPSLEALDGAMRGGWTAQIGVGWQP